MIRRLALAAALLAMVMGIAAIAAYVLGPGLGGFIFSGLSRLGGANALADAQK